MRISYNDNGQQSSGYYLSVTNVRDFILSILLNLIHTLQIVIVISLYNSCTD